MGQKEYPYSKNTYKWDHPRKYKTENYKIKIKI